MTPEFYHAHIYYDTGSAAKAGKFRDLIADTFRARVRVSRMVDRPIGPHPVPMFEVDFRADDRAVISAFLDSRRDGLSVLVHPVIDDEVTAHTQGAIWMGSPVELNIQFLRDFMSGQAAPVGGKIHSDP